MINYDVALILEPLTLLGTIAGVVLNVVMTTAEVLITLVLVLSVTAWKTFEKGFEQKAKEDKAPKQPVFTAMKLNQETSALQRFEMEETTSSFETSASGTTTASEFLENEQRQYPWEKILLMVLLWGVHAAIMVCIGGPKGLLCGGWKPKALLTANVLFQVIFSLFWRCKMLQKQEQLDDLGLKMDFQYDQKTTVLYPLMSMFAGICAGALGIAGGLIKGPLMLNWGLLPQQATSTAIFMIMFTSSSTILQFALLGRLEFKSAVIFWLTGFFGGLMGSKVVGVLMKNSGRQSYLTLFLALLIVLSGLSMSGISVARLTGLIPSEHESVGSLCE